VDERRGEASGFQPRQHARQHEDTEPDGREQNKSILHALLRGSTARGQRELRFLRTLDTDGELGVESRARTTDQLSSIGES
jgi:hypothetical protein